MPEPSSAPMAADSLAARLAYDAEVASIRATGDIYTYPFFGDGYRIGLAAGRAERSSPTPATPTRPPVTTARIGLYPDHTAELLTLAARHGGVVEKLARYVITYPHFCDCSGSVSEGKHHYGTGGLQHHTAEVVRIALETRVSAHIEADVPEAHALLAALYHDLGKTWDYAVTGYVNMGTKVWGPTPHKRLINHMNRSALLWSAQAAAVGYPAEDTDAILHAILAHHAEHGSSVMPKTKLAWLLHLSDQLSAWMDQCDRRDPTT